MSNQIRISKSLYIRGLQCLKSLYMEKHNRELKVISERTQSLFDNGNLVGDTARDLFPGGVLIPYIPYTPGKSGQAEQVRLTNEAMASGATVIYEAAFLHNGAFSKVDILVKSKGGWNIYEVKSGTTPDPIYLEDIAFQYHVLTGAEISVKSAFLVYINNQYVRQGELDLKELFTREDVTQFARGREPFVIAELSRQRAILSGGMPECGIGKQCTNPYDCDFMAHCWAHIPEDSVFDLKGNGIDKYALYGQGIVKQADIPVEILAGMSAKQRQQVEATIRKENSIDTQAIRAFLNGLQFPLCLFDVETFISPIPLYDEMKPYQQTAFQYSLHVIEVSGDIRHHGFLSEPGIDPRRPFIESLTAHMPVDGSVVAFNKSFECGILQALAKRFPEYGDYVNQWVAGMVDLMVPFRQRDIYIWQMKGSYSIKFVLPALCPELSYDGLEIANGQAAMDAYNDMCKTKNDPEKLATIRANLLQYCYLDTFGMVRIIEELRGIV